MQQVKEYSIPPDGSIITKDFPGRIDYTDAYSIRVNTGQNDTIDYFTARFFTSWPWWADRLLKLRNHMVMPFGLETGSVPDQGTISRSVHYPVGDRAVFFTVIDRTDTEIVMAEDDKHLYFRTSLFMDRAGHKEPATFYLTTLVQFHNLGGKIYFAPVKPFHKFIIKAMLSDFSKSAF